MNLLNVLERAAARNTWWAGRWEAARSAALELAAMGAAPGQVVALGGADSDQLVSALIACWQLGALPAPCGPTARVPDGPWQRAVDGIVTVPDVADLPDTGPGGPLSEAGDEAPALLSWTSGTTGPPKAVALRSSTVTLATACIADRQRLQHDDVVLCTTPATSSFQLVAALLPAAHAGCRFVPARSISGDEVWRQMDEVRATVLAGYTPVLAEVLAGAPAGGTTLRLAICGGAPCPSSLKRRFRTEMRVTLVEAYGQSELGGFAAMGDPADSDPRALTHAGRPLPDRPAWADGDGQLVIAGEAMIGYLGDPKNTEKTLAPPGLHTGDVGTCDRDGYIRVLGRRGDQLPEGRWPRAVEDALFEAEDVLHAALLRQGARAVAAVSPRPGCHIEPEQLARAAEVDRVLVIATMPRTPSGKYDRNALKSRIEYDREVVK